MRDEGNAWYREGLLVMTSSCISWLWGLVLGGTFAQAQDASLPDSSLKTDFDRGIVELRTVFSDNDERAESVLPVACFL